MAKLERRLNGDFKQIIQKIENGILKEIMLILVNSGVIKKKRPRTPRSFYYIKLTAFTQDKLIVLLDVNGTE